MEDKNIPKPKIRIQLLDEYLRPIEDRLVDQTTEFYLGPKKAHKGPVKFEITLADQLDIDNFKAYIDKLRSDLPIKEISSRGRPSNNSSNANIDSPREDILLQIEKMEDQDEAIKYLRDLGFVFLLTEDFLTYFPEFEFDTRDIGKPNSTGQYLESLCWMVRCIKRAKDPKSDKYDKMIIFGIHIQGGRSKKVVPYLYGERKKPLRIEYKDDKKLSFSKVTELTKYPHYMTEDERLKFGTEFRQLTSNKDKKPTKFFLRWYKDVKFSDENKKMVEEIVNR